MHLTLNPTKLLRSSLLAAFAWVSTITVSAEVQMTVVRNSDLASPAFSFNALRSPLRGDRAASAQFSIIDGRLDPNSGGLDALHDGRTPSEEDEPASNFFFAAGTRGGRLLVDLTDLIEIKQINTFSWHAGSRGPQVYSLFASDGQANGFNPAPTNANPESCGWKLVAKVDTRPKDDEVGGQYAVSLSDPNGILGKYRYLLFVITPTESNDPFGNTFYSEIDVLDSKAPVVEESTPAAKAVVRQVLEIEGGRYQITIDTSETPDLTDWVKTNLAPVVVDWYPKLVQFFPSEGYEAPNKITIVFKDMQGVADTAGKRIRCAASWFRQNLKGEATGAVVHELVHIVQQYGRAKAPGWVTEGIADYTRFFVYEPQNHGAEISLRGLARARYDASYRTTANFLNWVSEKYDAKLVTKLNALIREGKYNEETWKSLTEHTASELGDEWKQALEKKLKTPVPPDSATNAAAGQ